MSGDAAMRLPKKRRYIPPEEYIPKKRKSLRFEVKFSKAVDLSVWKNQHVHAKRDGVYLPAVIKQVNGSTVEILFDKDQTTCIYDVHNDGKYDIIAGYSPRSKDIKCGLCVCVRIDTDENIFTTGVVIRKSGFHGLYCVMIANSTKYREAGTFARVSRASIKLLLPPWWKESELDFQIPWPL